MSEKIQARRQKIVELSFQQKSVVVDDLAEALGVSAQTVRRDINHLCDINLLRRRHGGAEVFETERNAPYDQRAATNSRAKGAIAAVAAELIPDGSSVAISVGTTPMMVADALSDKRRLTVITNNLNAAMALGREPSNRIILPGGELRVPDRDFVGDHVVDFFGNYRTDVGVFGVGGVAEDGTLLDFRRSEVRIRETIRANSRLSILPLDHTKFGRSAPAIGGALADMDRVVLDIRPGAEFDALLDELGDRLMLAGSGLQ